MSIVHGVVRTVPSADGTTIAFECVGAGGALVLVAGSICDRTYWSSVLPALAQRFTVICLDRRGRGDSGDTAPYAIEREVEDVVAVVDAFDDPVHLMGHSYGGICALEAALRTRNLRSLTLYEPPLGLDAFPEELIEHLDRLIADGRRDAAVELMCSQIVGLSDDALAALRADPAAWQPMLDSAHTLPRELRSLGTFVFDTDRYQAIEVPTVLLSGDESPAELRVGVQMLDAALEPARLVVMPGVDHEAVNVGPDTLTDTLITVLLAA